MAANFGALLEASARRTPDAPALVWDGGALSHVALHARAAALARALAARGVTAGDRLALAIGNRWPFAVALLAGWKLGATVVPLDMLLKPDERAAILRDLAPVLTMEEADVEQVVGGLSPETRGSGDGQDRRTDREGPAQSSQRGLGGQPAHDPAPALILYTSGSTGRPKGAVLSHAAVAFANESWAGPVMALTESDVVLAALPLAHAYGLNGALLAPLLAGASVALVERFSPEAVLDAIRRHRVTVFPGVATMFRRLLHSGALATADFSSVRHALSGAAPCPWELAEEWRARTGIRILRGYGMTELFRPISYLAGEAAERPEAIGRPVPGVEALIVDETGKALPAGEIGELWIKSPGVMDSYVNAPEDTREVLTNGWFKTGDLARLTPEGFVAITGRKRERILRGGYSVFPPEVEAVLLTHPAVAEAAVIGAPHAELGEEIAAFVALKDGARATADDLVAWCRDRLAAFKYPRRVTILPALPRSATGKILKAQLAGGDR